MSKIYLNVTTSKYISGTSMRNCSNEFVELEINSIIPETFDDQDELERVESDIIEVMKTYCDSNNIALGIKYNNARVGTNMYQDQKYALRVFVPKGDNHYRRCNIEYVSWYKEKPININWLCSHDWSMNNDGTFNSDH